LPEPRPSTAIETRVRWCGLELIANLRQSGLVHRISGVMRGIAPRLPRQFPAANLVTVSSLFGLSLCLFIPSSTETAVANGDTRTLHLYHAHTGESIDATYRVDGHYDPAVLQKLNWFLRDWRRNEETNMDPRLFDAVWEAYRGAGATKPITVVCGYRSPQTNEMLRHRSRGVAEHSQHILGKAMDTTMPGMSMERVREVAMRLQMGGVGYYGDSNFVHIDVGGVRAWPRMSYDQLVRLFPDGKTVHIAADGRTLARYDEARVEIAANGGTFSAPPPAQGGNFFAWLFGKGGGGGGGDEHEDAVSAPAAPAEPAHETVVAQNEPAATDQADNAGDAATAQPPAPAPVAARDDQSADAAPPVPPRRPVGLVAISDVSAASTLPNTQVAMAVPASPDIVSAPSGYNGFGNLVAASPMRAADLPGIITQGPNDGRRKQGVMRASLESQSHLLAYAPIAQMEGLRSAARDLQSPEATGSMLPSNSDAALVPARLDGTNFRSLIGATETAEIESQTIFGPTLTGLRRAARVETAALSSKLESDYLERFGVAATDLPVDHFSGPSVAGLSGDRNLLFVDSSGTRQGD